jgi:hypothetical protein
MGTYPHDGPYTAFSLGPQTSTNSWVALGEAKDVHEHLRTYLRLVNENNNGNDVDFRVVASLDYGDTFPVTLKTSTTLTAGASNTTDLPEPVTDIKVEITSSTADSPDAVSGTLAAYKPQ